jgi:hypothetical protein
VLYFFAENRTAMQLLHGLTKSMAPVREAEKKIGRTRNGEARSPSGGKQAGEGMHAKLHAKLRAKEFGS